MVESSYIPQAISLVKKNATLSKDDPAALLDETIPYLEEKYIGGSNPGLYYVPVDPMQINQTGASPGDQRGYWHYYDNTQSYYKHRYHYYNNSTDHSSVYLLLPGMNQQRNNYIGISADFKCNALQNQFITGSYGLIIRLYFDTLVDSTNFEEIILDSSKDFFGNIYNSTNYLTQSKVQNITYFVNKPIAKVCYYLYQGNDFMLADGTKYIPPSNQSLKAQISVQNIKIYFGENVNNNLNDNLCTLTLQEGEVLFATPEENGSNDERHLNITSSYIDITNTDKYLIKGYYSNNTETTLQELVILTPTTNNITWTIALNSNYIWEKFQLIIYQQDNGSITQIGQSNVITFGIYEELATIITNKIALQNNATLTCTNTDEVELASNQNIKLTSNNESLTLSKTNIQKLNQLLDMIQIEENGNKIVLEFSNKQADSNLKKVRLGFDLNRNEPELTMGLSRITNNNEITYIGGPIAYVDHR